MAAEIWIINGVNVVARVLYLYNLILFFFFSSTRSTSKRVSRLRKLSRATRSRRAALSRGNRYRSCNSATPFGPLDAATKNPRDAILRTIILAVPIFQVSCFTTPSARFFVVICFCFRTITRCCVKPSSRAVPHVDWRNSRSPRRLGNPNEPGSSPRDSSENDFLDNSSLEHTL